MKILGLLSGAAILASGFLHAADTPGTFEKQVQPILRQTCTGCHNEKLASGGLNIVPFLEPGSIALKKEGWERILSRVRAGEMPPKGIPAPPAAEMAALIDYVRREIDRADAQTPLNPGRVVARRLNRAEYTNTIRDLLGVAFRASEEFPADDSGYGFDNIGDVLTVSPTLMQKYLQAAERIASRAVGGDPLPKPGFFNRKDRARRLSASAIHVNEIVEYDAEYIFKVNLVGRRGAGDKPVTLVMSIDGKPVKTETVSVQISAVNQQGGATQRSSQEVAIFLPAGEHNFKAEFVNDEGLAAIPENARLNPQRNIFPEAIEIGGPYPYDGPRPWQKTILTCDPVSPVCAERILTGLARRAFRRPVAKTEVAGLMQIYQKALASDYSPAQSLQFALAAILVSPHFLYRIERDPKLGTAARISDVELASRLSYFLWSSMPDEELLKLGETNRLHLPEVLTAQVKRMIADQKSSAFAENFVGQWLETRSLDAIKPDARKFPEWSPELKDAMRTETQKFFEAVVRDDAPLSDFLDGKYTFLNDVLAKHYGITGVTGPEFRRVDVSGDQRSGVLTQGSILTVSSYPTRTSVVLRGKYLLENILNSPPPPPPPDVPSLNEEAVGVATSLRQQMEKHRADALCASCHSKMDVLGFALENYDAIGRWRTQDGKFPVDSSGALPNGKSFSGPAEMKALLKENMPEFSRSLAEKMLTYALGRGVESYDRRTIQNLVNQTSAAGYKMQTLILGIVNSAPFQQRRAEATK